RRRAATRSRSRFAAAGSARSPTRRPSRARRSRAHCCSRDSPGTWASRFASRIARAITQSGCSCISDWDCTSARERSCTSHPVVHLVARPAALRGTEVSAAEVPTLVDEVPVLAVLASRASEGSETVFREVGELRVKESNRLELIAANLRAVGVEAEARDNDLF